MYRRRYQVMADELTQAADEYLDRVLDVQEARKDFMERHGADACQNKMPEGIVTGLRFGCMPPEGWTLVDDGRGFSVPDTGTAKGFEIAREMRALPAMPLPVVFSRMIDFDPPLKATPERKGVFVGVERMDGDIYVSVPVFSREEIQQNPALSWSQPAGITEVVEDEYDDVKRKALSLPRSLGLSR